MSIIDAIVLGFVQGVTEFIPVSSSGHLVITSTLLGVGNSFTFDVLLNLGTLLALIIFYRKRIWSIITRVFTGKEWSLVAKIIIATIPAVAFGLAFDDLIEQFNGHIAIVIVTLILVGMLMVFGGKENKDADNREIEKSVNWINTLKIGFAQMLALIPGVSRSGITIFAGLRTNLTASRAAEFSFLLAIPVITGAIFKTMISDSGVAFLGSNLMPFVVGNIVSFITGIIAISFLIKLISKRGLKDFGYYRIGLALVLTVLLILGIL